MDLLNRSLAKTLSIKAFKTRMVHSDKLPRESPLINNQLCRLHKVALFTSWAQMQRNHSSHTWTTTSWAAVVETAKEPVATDTRQHMASLEASMARAWTLRALEYLWQVVQTRKPWAQKEISIKVYKMASSIFRTTQMVRYPWTSVCSVLIVLRRWIHRTIRQTSKYPCSREEDNKPHSKEQKMVTTKISSTRQP